MLRPTGFMVLLSALPVSAAIADVAPGPIITERETAVSWALVELRHARVDISVGRTDPAIAAGATAASASPAAVARVDCSFELYCTAGEPARQPFSIVFPVGRCDDPAVQATGFTIRVDGVRPEKIVSTDRLYFAGDRGTYWGYQWPVELQVQGTTRVNVSYLLRLDLSGGWTFFRYVLRSGGTWSTPIGEETVTLRHGPGLHIRPVATTTIWPEVRAGTLVWELRRVRPTEDIELWVRPG
jgi:hypothetical protein